MPRDATARLADTVLHTPHRLPEIEVLVDGVARGSARPRFVVRTRGRGCVVFAVGLQLFHARDQPCGVALFLLEVGQNPLKPGFGETGPLRRGFGFLSARLCFGAEPVALLSDLPKLPDATFALPLRRGQTRLQLPDPGSSGPPNHEPSLTAAPVGH